MTASHGFFLVVCVAIGAWIILSERARKKKLSASESYIAECRKAREERARREATKFLEARPMTVQPLSPAEQYIARRLKKKLTAALSLLTEAKDAAYTLTPAILAQLGTQEALCVVARRLGEIRDHAKGERLSKQEVHNGT
jgi:hypothetical protein